MKLIRYAYPQTQTSNALNHWFDLSAPNMGRLGSLLDDFMGSGSHLNRPLIDLYEDDHHFFARFELAGFRKDQVDIELEDAVLTVSTRDANEEGNHLSRYQFERSIPAPDGVDLGQISAQMKDGILTITMPKAEALKPRQITIE